MISCEDLVIQIIRDAKIIAEVQKNSDLRLYLIDGVWQRLPEHYTVIGENS